MATEHEQTDYQTDATALSEHSFLVALRPQRFDEYIGQKEVLERLKVAVFACKERGDTLDHALLHGPPGLGKTTLATIVARELDARLVHTSGPALERPADVVGILSNLDTNDVFFIDEIHRLSRAVEEYLYLAMEDFRVDFTTGAGAFARSINLPLNRFTLIGSTTRAGMLSSPLRDRFGLQYRLDFYDEDDILKVVQRSAGILKFKIDADAAGEIARRARGTPRVANRLLRRVRDYIQVKHKGKSSRQTTIEALELEGVDELGLNALDRLYLKTIAENYNGGPAGIDAIAATINEEAHTLTDIVEPFLLKNNFIIRTSHGRKTTPNGEAHIGVARNANQARF